MTTPRAPLHVASGPEEAVAGEISDLARNFDPLRRLEAELQRARGERPDGERLHEQAWGLLEEAWGLVTECLVLRDGLLDACHEIEQTMAGIQRRLGALPEAVQPGVQQPQLSAPERGATSKQDALSAFDRSAAP